MNEPMANPVAAGGTSVPPEPRRAGQRIFFLAALGFAAQLGLIYFLGTHKATVPRAVTNAPHFQLTATADEIIALGNPTLFALPHANDFSARVWMKTPTNVPPDFRWQEPPRWLSLDPKNLGGALKEYLQTNAAAETPLNFKTEPQLDFPEVTAEIFLPKQSSLQISGALAQRKLLVPISLPTLAVNEVIAPSRVQVLVAPDGTVFSAVLLESCGYADVIKPDQLALQLASAAQFAPADGLMIGELLFKWHTEPVAGTNKSEAK
jgi:hypothetical protein